VRFRDISRGGIRVIKSANPETIQRNSNGQFSETYDLALTQNKKNKDIPEFGSKVPFPLLFRPLFLSLFSFLA
jgi:glutamate dehydrogenase